MTKIRSLRNPIRRASTRASGAANVSASAGTPTSNKGAWLASWRLTRAQLEKIAAGKLPREWIRWAKADLAFADDLVAFRQRVNAHVEVRKKK